MFKSTQRTDHKKKVVIKLGGSMLGGLNKAFFKELQQLQGSCAITIVHGGGPAINKALAKAAIPTTKINGLRVTTDAAIGIVAETLIGQVNPMLVGELNEAGFMAIGLNGQDANLLHCHYLDKAIYGHVGEVDEVNATVIEQLQTIGIIPVVSCIGTTSTRQLININGDTAASALALALQAEELLFVTDIEGIQINNEVIEKTTEQQINNWITSGDIYGGMIPKVLAAVGCVAAGVPNVKIVGHQLTGTTIHREKVTLS
ncbi:acetylglutamate kinase [Kurthia sibirica]|nr:acetylglutamate kinase [Kurthia sibirica]